MKNFGALAVATLLSVVSARDNSLARDSESKNELMETDYIEAEAPALTDVPLESFPEPERETVLSDSIPIDDSKESETLDSFAESRLSTYPAPYSPWAIAYSPYTIDGLCKSTSTIESDIEAIASKRFRSIRLHSADCSILSTISPQLETYDLSLILGIYIPAPSSDAQTSQGLDTEQQDLISAQIQDIMTWASSSKGRDDLEGGYKHVEMIVLGNEAIFNGFLSASDLADLLGTTRAAFHKDHYRGMITTTEPLQTMQENAATLCPYLDVVAANIQPYFHHAISAFDAGEYIAHALAELRGYCPSVPFVSLDSISPKDSDESNATSMKSTVRPWSGWKEVFNLETGWPRSGVVNGRARPGVEEQRIAIESILEEPTGIAGSRSVFASWEDEEWRGKDEWGVERSWGCGHVFESV
ncbi:hypothetical protein MMC25_000205 [Agyrium rufum]|nr:hypothetical protein [Agyrium rufum]